MFDKQSYHMTLDQFEKYAKETIDLIVDYYRNIESYPVLSQVKPGDIKAKMPETAPQVGEDFDTILRDIDKVVMPGITHWQSPGFFAYFPSNISGPSIIGELLSAGLGVQGMLWATSPACTEIETRVLDWLVNMLGLPDKFLSTSTGGGVIQDTASSAVLCAVVAAREMATNNMSNKKGVKGDLIAYTSKEAHSSVEKAIRISGIGSDNLRLVDTDESFAMKPDVLEAMIQEDKRRGLKPFFVSSTVGTTSSNGIDPVYEIGRIAKKEDLWLHVDAAMVGTAAICPEYRFINRGLEYADSYCFNPHKWMFTNFDCDCFYVAQRKHLINALSVLPEYLKNKATESGAVFDYRDWHVPLGRRFRSLKLWFVIRHYGVNGIRYHIRKHIQLAQEFASLVRESDEFELVSEPPFNLVCFRYKGTDDMNKKILDTVNESGEIFITHTKLNGKYTMRMSIGQSNTERKHVIKAWNLIRKTAKELQ